MIDDGFYPGWKNEIDSSLTRITGETDLKKLGVTDLECLYYAGYEVYEAVDEILFENGYKE